jgi:hypothetical protein
MATDDAWGIEDPKLGLSAHERLIWLPKRLCEVTLKSGAVGGDATAKIPRWLAEKEGLV